MSRQNDYAPLYDLQEMKRQGLKCVRNITSDDHQEAYDRAWESDAELGFFFKDYGYSASSIIALNEKAQKIISKRIHKDMVNEVKMASKPSPFFMDSDALKDIYPKTEKDFEKVLNEISCYEKRTPNGWRRVTPVGAPHHTDFEPIFKYPITKKEATPMNYMDKNMSKKPAVQDLLQNLKKHRQEIDSVVSDIEGLNLFGEYPVKDSLRLAKDCLGRIMGIMGSESPYKANWEYAKDIPAEEDKAKKTPKKTKMRGSLDEYAKDIKNTRDEIDKLIHDYAMYRMEMEAIIEFNIEVVNMWRKPALELVAHTLMYLYQAKAYMGFELGKIRELSN